MFKYIILISLFVVGINGGCTYQKRMGCVMDRLAETEITANKSQICSDMSRIAACENKLGCQGDSGLFSNICTDSNCSPRKAVNCMEKLMAAMEVLMGSINSQIDAAVGCFTPTKCLDVEDMPTSDKNICIPLNSTV